jgi:hypothetical protein
VAHTLARRFRFRTPDQSVFDVLRFLDCTPDIDGVTREDIVIDVEPFRGRLRILADGSVLKEVLNGREALEFLHVHLFASSISDRPAASVLHAACLRRDGRRILLSGSKGAGKSTLALRLIQAGYAIEGDEHVFVERTEAIARPRGCRVREASLRYVPEMADAIAQAPYVVDYNSERIFNVDPRTLGAPWQIEQGKVDAVFALKPNHGGYSSVRPMQPSALVQFLISETGWRDTDRGISVANIAALVTQTKAFDLSLGDHTSAIRCINLATNS